MSLAHGADQFVPAAAAAFPPAPLTPVREMAELLRLSARGSDEQKLAAELAMRVLDRAASAARRGDCVKCGRDSCLGDCLDLRGSSGPRFVVATDVLSEPPGESIVEDMARAGAVVVLAGESGAGKGFVMMSLCAAISDGQGWHGRAVKRGSVAYIAFEADALPLRLQALKDQGATLDNFYLLRASDPISPRVGRDGIEEPSLGEQFVMGRLQQLVVDLRDQDRPPVVAIVFDTVRASLSGSEDTSEHVAGYLRAGRRILTAAPGAAEFLVHHSGWQDGEAKKKRERGSSAFRGNADATLYLEVVEEDPENHRAYLELRTLKLRDAERPAPLRLVRERVDVLGFDSHGHPLSSCVISADPRRREDREAAAAAEVEAEDRKVDVRTLRAIADRPELATSQERIRELLGVGKAIVSASVARIIRAGLVVPGRRGEPYTLTPEGSRIAREQASKP